MTLSPDTTPASAADPVARRLRSARALLEELAAEDASYRRENFVTLDELCRNREASPAELRRLMSAGVLPQAAYLDEDGSELVAPDFLELVDDGGGVENLRAHFRERYRRAAEELGDETALAQLEDEWEAFLRGTYGICLRHVTPENIVRKDHLMRLIEGLLERPDRAGARWRAELAAAVTELDSLERPFAPLDEFRLGARPSRRRLVDDVRSRYPEAFPTD